MTPQHDRGAGLAAVLFDVGNTLLHLDLAYLAGLAGTWGARPSPEDVGAAAALVGRAGWPPPSPAACRETDLQRLFSAIGQGVGLDASAACAFARSAEREHRLDARGLWRRPAPGAADVLSALRGRGLSLGVVSNADGRVEAQLGLAGLAEFFDVILDSDLVGVAKPDPRIFAMALERLAVPPAAALHVGDLPDLDVEAAREAGLGAVLYDPWDVSPEFGPDRILRLEDLLERIP